MLIYNFTRIFKARGIDRPFSYLVGLGYSANFATRVVNNRVERLNLSQLEKLCVQLHCTPNDLLAWIPDPKEQNVENHPLISLRRTQNTTNLNHMLNAIPLDKLSEIEEMVRKELEK
jgi:hypothetical protein